jgi:fatty-acyl-CoA synthase
LWLHRYRAYAFGVMNFSRIVETWAAIQPDKTAVHFRGRDLSYAELWRRIAEASLRLAALGVARGDRVAYLGCNSPEILVLLFALARIGAMLVPLNFRLAPPEHQAILDHSGAKWLLAEREFHAHGDTLRAALPGLSLLSLEGAREGWLEWNALPVSGTLANPAGEDADPVLIVYTSGTTGKPKGAVHTQSGLVWNAINATHYQELTGADHVLTVLPMFHVGGLCIQTLPALHAGATVTLHPRFDPGAWLSEVASRRPTLTLLVPAVMRALVDHPAWKRTDLTSLRMAAAGSSTIPDSLIAAFHEHGVTVTQIYGATETGPVSIYLRAEDARRKAGSAGKAALHAEVRLVDANDRDVAQGKVGEILVRGPNVMQGYWKDPDNPSFRDGWFRSGDLAYQDEEGFYFVVGRSKDMIISGGENIYPAELENVLADCDRIAEAAVIGLEDAKWGEVAVAVVGRRPGSALNEADVRALYEGRLARYKHPRRVVFMESLPKNAMGKVQKFELRRLVVEQLGTRTRA